LERKAVTGTMVTLVLVIMTVTPFVEAQIGWYDWIFIAPEFSEVYVGENLVVSIEFGHGFEPFHPPIVEFSLGWDSSFLELVSWESLWGSPTVVVGNDSMRITIDNPFFNVPLLWIEFKAKTVGSTILALFDSNVYTVDGYVDILREYPITVTVDDDGPADFHSIQEAIRNSSRGDTIYVKAGTYYEHIVVNKTLLLIGENKELTIIDGNGTGTVVTVTASNVNITEFTIQNSGNGYLDSGIFLTNTIMNNISGNIITQNKGSTVHGMLLQYSENNVISGNTVSNNGWGIELQYYSNNNFIHDNIIANNSVGMVLYLSKSNKIRNNTINYNLHNFGVYGGSLSRYINDIDTSNTVNGKPIYYLINQENLIINPSTFPDIGYLGIINSSNIRVENLNLTNNFQGLLFSYTHNSTIIGINSSNNSRGIELGASNGNLINENIITNNGMGIALFDSSGNAIKDNTVTENSQWGIWYQATLYDSTNNVWHNDYPSGGNYWSDYNGTDLYSGPYQNETGSDGIGDLPHMIDEDNTDRYPLINPWSPPDIEVENVTLSKSVIGQGFTLQISATVENQGNKIEECNITAIADTINI